jgi:hypothetical protein
MTFPLSIGFSRIVQALGRSMNTLAASTTLSFGLG